ncbi:hypothetical protein P5E48_11515 [Clostridium perfringens]|nr:hypothetical protein [Clostridium perfringens]MDK0793858.1 hypothetical protein [Clostridium perfringens]
MDYIKNFNLQDKEFSLRNDEDDNFCYKTQTGICSLELSESEARRIYEKRKSSLIKEGIYGTLLEKYSNDNTSSLYCKNIYKLLIKQEMSPIYISKNKCGHYTVNDGLHRLCIARKKNLTLNAYIDEGNKCWLCAKRYNK